jgi:hypothetical protein
MIVKNNPCVVWEWFFSIKLWWAHVTVTPDDSKIAVFKRGTWNGLNVIIFNGGQFFPISIVGDRLLWKKAQKNLRKKKISEMINKIIPHRRPIETEFVCNPWKVPSREMSRHHWYIVIKVIKFPKINKSIEYWWNHFVKPAVSVNAPIAPVNGQGLKSTKWKGWLECVIVDINNYKISLE